MSLSAASRRDLHAEITGQLIAAIEASPGDPQLPWLQSARPLHLPRNVLTKNCYRGINILQLWSTGVVRGYEHQVWASYRQWAQLGGQVRRGERGTAVAFYKAYEVEPRADDPDDDGNRRVLKTSIVFNIHQIDGYALLPSPMPPTAPADPWEPLEPVEDFIATTGAEIRHGGEQAYYNRSQDVVQMPERTTFVGTETSSALEAYYAVLCHELTHWTGAPHRLNRTFGQRFGDRAYSFEELVAEIASAFLSAELKISPAPRADHAQYLQSWMRLLKDDKRAIFLAAAKASEAVQFLKGEREVPRESQSRDQRASANF